MGRPVLVHPKVVSLPLYIGVDPGLRGAISVFNPTDGSLEVHDMPLATKKSGLHDVDPQDLAAIIEKHARFVRYAIVEHVGAMTYIDRDGKKRGQGAAASFAFGKATGTVLGVLGAFYIPVIPVVPSVWKSLMGLSSNKGQSLAKAKDLFPLHGHHFSRAKDDGRAESALLAYFGADRFK